MKKQPRVEGRESKAAASDAQPSTLNPQPITEVSAALIFRDGKLLITQRHAEAHLGGLWEFPGGKREPDETFEQCLVREIREELGVEISVGELFESVTHAYPEKTVHLKFFVCHLFARRTATARLQGGQMGRASQSWRIMSFRRRTQSCWKNCATHWILSFKRIAIWLEQLMK